MKVKLVLQPDQFSSFTSYYLEPLWKEYFDIEIYNSSTYYDKSTLFVFWAVNVKDDIVNKLQEQGCKIVIDNLWESYDTEYDKFYQLNNLNWFWWNESLWWRALGYHGYSPTKNYKNLALMPIRKIRPNRNYIVDKLGPLKDQMIWSYKNQKLPNDNGDQRFMSPDWYNDSYLSLVVETMQNTPGLIISEKSYKPCAFFHPMLIIGLPGVLAVLKQQGFETFDNIFDESYDTEVQFAKRLNIIIENLNNFKMQQYSDETWSKLEHNHNHFFNEDLCKQGIVREIIKPLLHYAET